MRVYIGWLLAAAFNVGACVSGNETAPGGRVSAAPSATLNTNQTLFVARYENAGTEASWADQELSCGQPFRKGHVPAGSVIRAIVDGAPVPCQVSNRIYWTDGSLKHAQVRMQVPVLAAGAGKEITFQRVAGQWNDTPLHRETAAITNNVALEYALTSWKGRNAAGDLTEERGPLRLNSTTMLAAGNAPWTEKIMSGPLCNEWRVSDMASTANGARHPHLGGYLYVRAWGGTATTPKRIQFLFRTIYGWNTDVAADEQGVRADADLIVNGRAVRGNSAGTPGWSAIQTWKGGFLTSASTSGLMDWYDVATRSFVTPPPIIYRHNVAYGIESKFFPPFDTNNGVIAITPASYLPARRGPLRPIQDDVADHEMLSWTTSKPMARAIIAHARADTQQLRDHQQHARAAAWGMGAMTGVGLNRVTRKIICYLPPTKSSNQKELGGSVYDGTRPANAAGALRPEIKNLDAAHFPQMAFWPYLSEGDQHFLDLLYHEATLPGLFEAPAYGFFGTSSRSKIPFGGIVWRGQIRSVGHASRPMGNVLAIGNPADPHYTLAADLFKHWCEMTREVPREEDAWRGGLERDDSRRFQDLKLLWPSNEPTYKVWMHTFGLHSLAYTYGTTENPDALERAQWLAHAPTVLAGGWHLDANYLMKPDPTQAVAYHNICMDGVSNNPENRRYWHFGQWREAVSPIIYKADGQTCEWPNATNDVADGMIVTISGVRGAAEPHWVSDNSKVPGGLTRGIPYYTVQANGKAAKLSLSVGGAPVTFDTAGADMAGQAVIATVGGVHAMRPASSVSVDANSYLVQVMCALDMYQHYVAPADHRVLLARNHLFALKNGSKAPNAYDERGKTIVPRPAPWSLTGTGSASIDTPEKVVITALPGAATSLQRRFTVVPGQKYVFGFTSDGAIRRWIGATATGSEIATAEKTTGAKSLTFVAPAKEVWVSFEREAGGTTNVSRISLTPETVVNHPR